MELLAGVGNVDAVEIAHRQHTAGHPRLEALPTRKHIRTPGAGRGDGELCVGSRRATDVWKSRSA